MNFVGAIQPACLANSDWIIANSLRLIRSHRVKTSDSLPQGRNPDSFPRGKTSDSLPQGKILIPSYIDCLQLIKQRQPADGRVTLLRGFQQECLQTQSANGFGKVDIRQF